ncbi:MAG TPA: 2,3-bisphosphoglycerate-independent phosphoglycerate mutase [Patescibacteria group bacterium]|nr:2,3-bisphosphoglycerate-independent phosphoglycerate mutase [Patescibacteria group bacterium]
MRDVEQKPPVVLVIIDGWGIGQENQGNAIALANTPTFDMLNKEYGYLSLAASGAAVGLPDNQNGNSEAGHMNLGAGRIVKQDDVVILDEVKNKQFYENQALKEALEHVQRWGTNVHIMGLLTDTQSAHADPRHVWALLDMCDAYALTKVWLHLFTDGRDSPPRHAKVLLQQLREHMKPNQTIASLVGRFYAMDRKKEWENTEKAYRLLAQGEGLKYTTAEEALEHCYNQNMTDEFLEPSLIVDDHGKPVAAIEDNDSVIFFNIRSDRARQLAKTFVQDDFETANPGAFVRDRVIKNVRFVGLTHFGPSLGNAMFAYSPQLVQDTVPMTLRDIRQLYLAESEKFAHITFFFNGGYAHPVGGEERQMIPSPDLAHYEQKPEMMTKELIDIIIGEMQNNRYDFYAVNIAAPDMIAHTGDLQATIKAVEATDTHIGRLIEEVKKYNGHCVITADHGNAEGVLNPSSGEVDTEHSSTPVPLYLVSSAYTLDMTKKDLVLGNVAPTICDLLGIKKPDAMTCESLLKK